MCFFGGCVLFILNTASEKAQSAKKTVLSLYRVLQVLSRNRLLDQRCHHIAHGFGFCGGSVGVIFGH